MEIELRVILLVVGLLILMLVAIDFYRRRPLQILEVGPERDACPIYDPNYDIDNEAIEEDIVTRYDSAMHQTYSEPELNLYDMDLSQVEELRENYNVRAAETIQSAEPAAPRKLVAITLMARNPKGFNGNELRNAFENAHLHFGRNEIFHRHSDDAGTEDVLFSVAKAVEPGYFDIDFLTQEHVPGIILFMVADDLANPAGALDQMVRCSKQFAFALNGELLDHKRQPLTLSTIDQYRAQISNK